MKTADLDRMAQDNGISLTRPGPNDDDVPVADDTKRKILAALNIDVTGAYEARRVRSARISDKTEIPKSYLPKALEHNRVWGMSLQLYELRSSRNWGIGDFEDLGTTAELGGSLGADFIGINPLHAPFLADPGRCSPYEPSNRQYLNPLYIAVDKLPGFTSTRELEARLEPLGMADLVNYAQVAQVKLQVLQRLWKNWPQAIPHDSRYDPADFEAFVKERGRPLRLHALFEVISFAMTEQGIGAGWHQWPADYQKPEKTAVVKFARKHADEVRFHMWLQWLAHLQLTAAADRARKAGLRIGLYLDLAVGEAMDGSATWSEGRVYISKATIGSPPDPLAPHGQDWKLAAFSPVSIASGKKSPYRRMVSAAMRYAGAVRIDHAAALSRLFLVPVNSRPDGGAYVDYPKRDLLKILAGLSAEYRCLVIGEDLGILPEGLREDLAVARILSYRILSYEQDEEGFKAASVYPTLALACISTHDHQTIQGWWRGEDIRMRAEHGIVSQDLTKKHLEERERERKSFKITLEPEYAKLRSSKSPNSSTLDELAVGAYRFIAKTPCLLVSVRLADLTNEKRPTNIPGTSGSYPNWKPKLSVTLEELAGLELLKRVAETMGEEQRGILNLQA